MIEKEYKIVWVAKYALTDGIFKQVSVLDGGYAYTEYHRQYKMGRDAFFTKTEAVKRAEELREKKIAALTRQLKKLERLAFG